MSGCGTGRWLLFYDEAEIKLGTGARATTTNTRHEAEAEASYVAGVLTPSRSPRAHPCHVPSALQGASIERTALPACHSWTKPQRLAATCARNHSCSRRHQRCKQDALEVELVSGPVIASSGAIRKTKMPPAQKKTWIALSAGGVGGAIECCCTWPMEYLKTQLQSFRTVKGRAAAALHGHRVGLEVHDPAEGLLLALHRFDASTHLQRAESRRALRREPILSEPVGR